MSADTTAITTTENTTALALAGSAANHYAAQSAFGDYMARKSSNTLIAQATDLASFAAFLRIAVGDAAPAPEALQADPNAWAGISWGLIKAFVAWMLAEGLAVASVNRKLATIKKYAALAGQAGAITPADAAMIKTVTGYGATESKRIDARRQENGQATRVGNKKASHVKLTLEQATALKAQPDTAQGRRDAVIMALLLDHGLRVGELVSLVVSDFDLKAGTFTFYREKVGKTQTHRLSADARHAVAQWLATDAPAMGALLRGSRKGGALTDAGMTDRAVTARVGELGDRIGVTGLSAHDCRHYWATRAADAGTDAFALRDAGGWSSLAMPSRYVDASAVANDRVKGF